MKKTFFPLSEAVLGKEYIIKSVADGKMLSKKLRGYGLHPGTKIKLLFASPSGNPCAYEILGTAIALRYEDSKNIYIKNTAAYD